MHDAAGMEHTCNDIIFKNKRVSISVGYSLGYTLDSYMVLIAACRGVRFFGLGLQPAGDSILGLCSTYLDTSLAIGFLRNEL